MFYRLMLAHLVGDFVLQNRWLVMRKRTPSGLALHVGLVGLAMVPVSWERWGEWWPWLLVILIVHAVTDWAKVRLEPRLRVAPIVPFVVDQAVHVLTIAAVAVGAEPTGAGTALRQGEPAWWVGSVYLMTTFGLSIALPLWLDPPSLMQRSVAPRLTMITASALVLTLAWKGLPMLIPVVALGLYQGVARRMSQQPVMATFAAEFLCALMVAASLGWCVL
jgi:hypothetical protein